MSGIESVGGVCPKCLKSMYQKFESSNYGFMFDACSHCGFAYGTVDTAEQTPDKVWEAIFEHFKISNKEELTEKLQIEEYTSKDNKELHPSVFDYSKDEDIHIIYKLIQGNTIKETKVEQQGESNIKGEIDDFYDGLIFIKWENSDDTSTYKPQDIGSKFKIIA